MATRYGKSASLTVGNGWFDGFDDPLPQLYARFVRAWCDLDGQVFCEFERLPEGVVPENPGRITFEILPDGEAMEVVNRAESL